MANPRKPHVMDNNRAAARALTALVEPLISRDGDIMRRNDL